MLAGVDGCKAGWVAALRAPDGTVSARVVARFEALLALDPALVAVDMPIGLPERVSGGGRPAERAVRPLLGARQSSVFAMPARAAVWSVDPQPEGAAAQAAAHRAMSAVALTLSDPPRKVSIQGFNILPKVRELDRLLRDRRDWIDRVFEVHPEAAFWRMNGERPLATPKKFRGRVNPEGMAERRALLAAEGLPRAAIDAAPPTGAAEDDWIDALAALVAAERLAEGRGRPHPEPPARDAEGLPVAIWTWV